MTTLSSAPTTSPKVFVSYARTDLPFVQDVVERLRTAGVDVWIDLQGISVGESFLRAIEAAIQAAPVCLVVVSRHSMNSKEVARELTIARSLDRKIIPVILQSAPMPAWLQERQWIDCRTAFDEPITHLLVTITGRGEEPAQRRDGFVAPLPMVLEGPERNLCPLHVSQTIVSLTMALGLQCLPVLALVGRAGWSLWPIYVIEGLLATVIVQQALAFLARKTERADFLALHGWPLLLPFWTLPNFWLQPTRLSVMLTFANLGTVTFTLISFFLAQRSPQIRRWAISRTLIGKRFSFLGIPLGRPG